jgi:nitrate reductase delta subunit
VTVAVDAWDRLADLIEYPESASYAQLVTAPIDVGADRGVAEALGRFRDSVAASGARAMQERYVEAFDFDPGTTLDLGWHLFGDTPDRGAFLAALREDIVRAGVFERGELPDNLAIVLRLIARLDSTAASKLAARITPAVARVHERLLARNNPYADVLDAIGRMVAGIHPE